MVKRTILALAVALLAAGTGVGAALISGSGHEKTAPTPTAKPTTHPVNPVVLRFVSKDSKENYVDANPSGLSAGDVLAQHSIWYENGAKAGAMSLTATVTLRTSAQTGEVMFTAVAGLAKGDLVFTGSFDIVPQNQAFEAAITGGTGVYDGARGYAVFDQVSANVTKVSLHLK